MAQLFSKNLDALSNTLSEFQSAGTGAGKLSEEGLGKCGINWHDWRVVLNGMTSPGGRPSACRGIF